MWGTYHLYLKQYGQIVRKVWNLKAKFGVHRGNVWIIVTHISGGKVWGSDKSCRSKIWGQAPSTSNCGRAPSGRVTNWVETIVK